MQKAHKKARDCSGWGDCRRCPSCQSWGERAGEIVSEGLEEQGREEWDQAVASQKRKLNSGSFPIGVRERPWPATAALLPVPKEREAPLSQG